MAEGRIAIGLVASASMRAGADSPLFRLVRRFESFFVDVLGARLVVEGDTFDSLKATGLLAGYGGIERLPPAREGGIIMLTAGLLGGLDGANAVDWIVHLLSPTDPTALYPETGALKRQCVVHGKPYLATETAASEWFTLEWLCRAADAVPAAMDDLVGEFIRPAALGKETIALIAHDSLKTEMLEFARAHRPLLARFGRRLATGTTGSLLNGRIPARLEGKTEVYQRLTQDMPAAEPWVQTVLSGPRGGDAQIAQEVLLGRCRRAVFFEDPHVAREHEADIQLLERAVRFHPAGALCLNSRPTAERWAENMRLILGHPRYGTAVQRE